MSNSNSKLKIKNINTIDKRSIGDGKVFEGVAGRFTPLFGMKDMGCSVIELAPGKKGCPYHLHYAEEEMFVIVSGSGSIRYADEVYPVNTGDVIYTPPGEGTAHQIINTSTAMLQYLAFSTRKSPEVCYYPDSGKYGSYVSDSEGNEKNFIAHETSEIDYFDGENN